jgi:hypothetical protein
MRRGSIWLATIVALAVPYLVFSRAVLFHFYVRGAPVLDSGLLADLLWHGDAWLRLPRVVGGGSYFATHVVPLFWLITAASWAVPTTMAGFFALFFGVSHALLAGAIVWLLVGTHRAPPWIAALLGIGFACGGLAFAIARFPHFETLIPAFFLLFLAARRTNHPRLALLFFVLGLATREDAGLHYAIVLLLTAAWNRWRGWEWRYAVAALVWTAAAMLIQHAVFPQGSAFVRIYLGDPLFAHLTWPVIAPRLANILLNRPYIILPGIGAAVWAALARDPRIAFGYLACLPWLALHLLAVGPLAAMLVSYYAFPFLIALAWPLYVGGRWPGFAALLALTFLPASVPHNPGRLFMPEFLLDAPSPATQAATERAIAAILRARPMLGALLADNSVVALAPNDFSRTDVLFGDSTDRTGEPDTVIFFVDGFDGSKLRTLDLPHHYAVPNTPIRLRSRLDLGAIPALAGQITPEQGP